MIYSDDADGVFESYAIPVFAVSDANVVDLHITLYV